MKYAIFGAATLVAALAVSSAASAGQCRDPWVTQAITQITGHAPRGSGESLDCNIKLYGNGSWSSYPDLVNKVKASYRDPGPALAPAAPALAGNAQPSLIGRSSGAAGIVAQGGGNIVAQGGGNIVAQGGGNRQNGGGIVAQGGGN
jgi:hypothetical protein